MRVNLKDYDAPTFIKVIREWTGLTQKEFGKRIGKSTRTIQDYEGGKASYSSKTLERLTKEFEISIIAEKE